MIDEDGEGLEYLAIKRAREILGNHRDMEDWMMEGEWNLFDIRIYYGNEKTNLERAMLMHLAHHPGLRALRESVIEWMVETRGFRDQVLKNLEADKL